jgi:CHAT domain-containing protein
VRDVQVVARHLGAMLLQAEPLRSLLLAHRRWVISPDGPLAFLPFESLPLDGSMAVLEHDIRQVQSLSVWQLLRGRLDANRAAVGRRALLAVGNPVFPRPTDTEPMWSELADSGREIQTIAAMFEPLGSQTLVQREATEAQVQALNRTGALRDFRYLHFATHAYVDMQDAERSAVVLGADAGAPGTDSRITAAEWAAFDLRSDLMVVSACETGIGQQVAGEGVMGLPYALYVAGNAATALSLWKADSAATADFMIAFFSGLLRGLDPVEAMAAVKRQYIREPRLDHYRRPYYWATFILYGP